MASKASGQAGWRLRAADDRRRLRLLPGPHRRDQGPVLRRRRQRCAGHRRFPVGLDHDDLGRSSCSSATGSWPAPAGHAGWPSSASASTSSPYSASTAGEFSLWSLCAIALNIFVLYALIVRWDDAKAERGSNQASPGRGLARYPVADAAIRLGHGSWTARRRWCSATPRRGDWRRRSSAAMAS